MEIFKHLCQTAKNCALICHVSPDGDTIGSALALRLILQKVGLSCDVFCDDPVPELYSFLPGADILRTNSDFVYDLAVGIDCADEARMGHCASIFRSAKQTVCIDHHGTNQGYAQHNIIDASAAAVGELICELSHVLLAAFDDDIALCLFVAISTDTGHFAFDSCTSRTFACMSEIMQFDLDLNALTGRLYRFRSLAKTRLLASVLSTLTIVGNDRGAMLSSTVASMKNSEAKDADYEGIVNYAIEITGVQIAALLRETESGAVKVSLRTKEGEWDAARIAASFGGGGHKRAAGCTLKGMTLPQAQEAIRIAMEAQLCQ